MAQDQYLSEKEIDEFLNDLDKNNNGYTENRIPREDFGGVIRGWKVPYMDLDKEAEGDHK
ncbi:hypothetical protein BGZ57DRAFT_946769 [Hyaloscypha finlandica]|nr:hypothetical protein BGZ57DRAFT_946769 [Hyaloscypha finlandica]